MNELHKYATFSVDMLGEPSRINNMFSKGRARIFYKGINRNRSIIEGEVANKLAATIAGCPIIGLYNYETEDFEGHDPIASAWGFIPLDPKSEWVEFYDENNQRREYLETDVIIWDGRFEEAQSILKDQKHLSMELNRDTLKGSFIKIDGKTYYNISFAEFSGITVLGDDVEPCFEDAQFLSAYSRMINEYALFVEQEHKNNEGGKNTMDNINEIVEPEVTIDTVVEESTDEVIETTATEVIEESAVEEEIIEPETEIVETVEAEEVEFACGDKKKSSYVDDVCPKCGKNPCECEKEDDTEDKDIEDDEDFKCKKDYEALYTKVKADYDSLVEKYNEALNSLNKYSKKEKLEIISKFSTKLESEELIEKLTNEVDNYSLEEIKSELGQALVEQLSTEEESNESSSNEANFSLNINLNDNSLGNTAWDLVRRHKESK